MYTIPREEANLRTSVPPLVGVGRHGALPVAPSPHSPCRTPDHRAFACHVPGCGKEFPNANAIALHKAKEHGDLRCTAQGCSLYFNSRAALQQHMQRKHLVRVCPAANCRMELASEGHKKAHYQEKHLPVPVKWNPHQAVNCSFEMEDSLTTWRMLKRQ